MSRVYSSLRGDEEIEAKESERQVGQILGVARYHQWPRSICAAGLRPLDTQVLGAHRRRVARQDSHHSAPAGVPPKDK